MAPIQPLSFQVNRDDFHDCRFEKSESTPELSDGQVLLKVDRFALTSNNISYAAAGDMLKYWEFFPAPDRWGRIPAMGFSDVVESKHPEIAVGSRCFGFVPMSRTHIVDAKASSAGFIDASPHREEHAMVYRSFTYPGPDALYDEAREDHILLLRGLFMTSFLVDDLMFDEDFYGATTSLITSASSKTSIALAHLLAARKRGPVVGLTSERNRVFVESLGCYDEVVLYDELDRVETLTGTEGALMVDMAGNGEVVHGVHERLQNNLKYSCTVGGTHWESRSRNQNLPGPQPEFFFAPARIAKRTQDWGGAGLQEKLGSAWRDFANFSDKWMKIQRHQGADALKHVYQEALAGRLDPREGHVLSLND